MRINGARERVQNYAIKDHRNVSARDFLAAGYATQFRFQQIGANEFDITSTTELA